MKKKLPAIILSALILLSLCISADAAGRYNYVYDETGLLNADTLEHFGRDLLPMLSTELGFDARIDIVDGTEELPIDECAKLFYEDYAYGQGEDKAGILLMIDIADTDGDLSLRQYTVYVSNKDASIFTDEDVSALRSYLDLSLNAEAWQGDNVSDSEACMQAMDDYVRLVGEIVRGEHPSPYEPPLSTVFTQETALLTDELSEDADVERNIYTPVFVADTAELLAEQERNELNDAALNASQLCGCGMYMITFADYMTDYPDMTLDACTASVYGDYCLGIGESREAVILTVNEKDGSFCVLTFGTNTAGALTSEEIQSLKNAVSVNIPENCTAAFSDFIGLTTDYLMLSAEPEAQENEKTGVSSNMSGTTVIIAVLVAALAAGAVCLILKSRNKSVYAQRDADEYIAENGISVTGRTDSFRNRTVERIPKQTSAPPQNRP